MNFEEKLIERLKRVEREVERLRVWERPGAWQDWTPTLTVASGALTSATASGSYCKIGNIVFVRVFINIINNGTGSDALYFTLPTSPQADWRDTFNGWAGDATSGAFQFPIIGVVNNAAEKRVRFRKIDGTYAGVTGNFYLFNGFYEI